MKQVFSALGFQKCSNEGVCKGPVCKIWPVFLISIKYTADKYIYKSGYSQYNKSTMAFLSWE